MRLLEQWRQLLYLSQPGAYAPYVFSQLAHGFGFTLAVPGEKKRLFLPTGEPGA